MIHITHRDGLSVVVESGVWLLEEYRTYLVHGAERAEWAGQSLPSSQCGALVLELGPHVGQHTLSVIGGGESSVHRFEVAANPAKLTGDHWLSLLQEIETWLPGAVTGPGGGHAGMVGVSGATAGWLAEALLPLVPALVRAVRALTDELRTRTRSPLEDRPLHTATALSSEALAWIARHPAAVTWVTGDQPVGKPPLVPMRVLRTELDHPANRTLRWLIERVARNLRAAATALAPALSAHRGWCEGRIEALTASATQLDRVVRSSPLSEIRAELALDVGAAVFVDDSRYARVLSLTRPFLSPAFSLAASEIGATLRPSYGLYEVWCLTKLDGALRALTDLQWTAHGHETVLRPGSSGEGFVLKGIGSAGRAELRFNATFRSHHSEGGDRKSITSERRPDFVLGWLPKEGPAAWAVLDAKYRIGEQLMDAFGSLHIYRDSLRWSDFGGRPSIGALLSPSATQHVAAYFHSSYLTEHRMGAFELRPGVEAESLIRWIAASLGLPLRGDTEPLVPSHSGGHGYDPVGVAAVLG